MTNSVANSENGPHSKTMNAYKPQFTSKLTITWPFINWNQFKSGMFQFNFLAQQYLISITRTFLIKVSSPVSLIALYYVHCRRTDKEVSVVYDELIWTSFPFLDYNLCFQNCIISLFPQLFVLTSPSVLFLHLHFKNNIYPFLHFPF